MYVPLKRIPLKYLVLVGFLISLIPLAVFVWRSTVIQKNVSLSWQELTDNSIESVRIAVELESLLVEIKRSTKQSVILQTESITLLADENIGRYQNGIKKFILVSPDNLGTLNEDQQSNINQLKETYKNVDKQALNSLLATLSRNQSEIMRHLWDHIDNAQAQQIISGQQKQEQVMLALLGVSFLTFLLLIGLSSQVAAPVNVLKKKISELGQQKQGKLIKSSPFNGPKELLEINVQLDRLTLRLTKLEMLRQSFLRHASHEFKTPLASIMESCAILKDEISGPLTKTQKEVVNILEDCSQNLKHLTEQLLEYNYLLQNSNPNVVMHYGYSLIDESIKRHEQFFTKRKLHIIKKCQREAIYTDAKLFTRIIDNLLNNAHVYSFEGGNVLIELSKDVKSDGCIIVVANTGPTVPVAQRNMILEPFYRSDVARHDSLPGTGLGLSIVRDCAHLLNGSVEFVDMPNFDFAIKIILPIKQ